MPTPEPLVYVDQQAVSIRDMPDLVAKVESALRGEDGFTLFTLNLDHLVKRRQDPRFRSIYSRATFVTADGWPVVSLARRHVPTLERTTGADMVVPLCRLAARLRIPVAFFGSSQPILSKAAARLRDLCPGLEIATCEAPPLGFDPLGSAADDAITRMRASGARLCFVALGAPKQEMFADRALATCPALGFVCIGAALDFIAEDQHRAPSFIQSAGLEWAWRLAQQPRRLTRRYMSCAWLYTKLCLSPDASISPDRQLNTIEPVARRLVLFHTMDPRGAKLGGIETHVRLMLARHPEATRVLFVGIDELGDLSLGRPVALVFEGREIDFLPVAHVAPTAINRAAKSIFGSTTLRYALGLLRYLPALRRATRGLPVSCEIERFEFALVPKLLRLPLVVLVHNEGSREDEMDSLLKRYWFLHLFNERVALALADKIFAVNTSIAERIERLQGQLGAKTEVMSVSVDTRRFTPTPFVLDGHTFRICFAGRLDAFKDPGLMFTTLAKLNEALQRDPAGRFRRVVFDYVGASEPATVASFSDIAEITVCHGVRTASEVAEIMRGVHAGIITSFFEGMPCYLLEMLASGRPVAAIRLPQFVPLILPGVTGVLVDRQESNDRSAEMLADALVDLAHAIDADHLEPEAIASCVQPYSVESQMHRLFACHEALARPRASRSYGSASIRSA